MLLSFWQCPPAKDQRGTPAVDCVGFTALYREEDAYHGKCGHLNQMTLEKTQDLGFGCDVGGHLKKQGCVPG